jgi:hypothetical protein
MLRLCRSRISAAPLGEVRARGDAWAMKTSYAVKWREPSGQSFLGRLELGPKALVLEGRNGGEDAVLRTMDLEELHGFRLGQAGGEQLDAQPTLVVQHADGDVLVTTAVIHAGVLQELVHRLSELRLQALRGAFDVAPPAAKPSC